jgi:hypothetical protein
LGKEYRSFSSSLCNFLHSPVTSKGKTQRIKNNYLQTWSSGFWDYSFVEDYICLKDLLIKLPTPMFSY